MALGYGAARSLARNVFARFGNQTTLANTFRYIPALEPLKNQILLEQQSSSFIEKGFLSTSCYSSLAEELPVTLEPVLDRETGKAYVLRIVTGKVRGAGSGSAAWVQLVGTHGKTQRFVVGADEATSLDRGSSRTIVLRLAEDIGEVQEVLVAKLPAASTTELDYGWFLQQVELLAPSGERTVFPCNGWLGSSDEDGARGPLERQLYPEQSFSRPPLAQPLAALAAGLSIPHPKKVGNGKDGKGVSRRGFGWAGEDAYFFTEGSAGAYFGLGVSDGVSMWRERGIDSGALSRLLMEGAAQEIKSGCGDATMALRLSVARSRAAGLQGSATACLLVLEQATGLLSAANLGDSGFMLLRCKQLEKDKGGRCTGSLPVATPSSSNVSAPRSQASASSTATGSASVGAGAFAPATVYRWATPDMEFTVKYRSSQLEHEFGRPFQVGHAAGADPPEAADSVRLEVSRGDVLVVGSDGLFDNLSDSEVVEAVTRALQQHAGPARVAQVLVQEAFHASVDRQRVTPYSLGASEAFDMVYSGGKKDDITVVVALIV